MQAETHKAAGVQHMQTGEPPSDTHLPTKTLPVKPADVVAVDPQLAKLRSALDGELGEGHMTWMK